MIIRLSLILILTACFTNTTVLARDIQFPATKLGVYQFQFHGAKYELEDQDSGDDGSEVLVGNVIFLERILLDVFAIGLKYGSGLTRTLELKLGDDDVTIEETASYQALELKTYADKHWKEGFKPYLAVGYGILTTSSAISIEPDSGTASDETTGQSIPIKSWCIGFDYILWSFILRAEIGQTNGSRIDLESSTTYQADYDYDTQTIALALGYLF